jgi:hypothetical protein
MSRSHYPYSVKLESPFCVPASYGDWGYDLEKLTHNILRNMCIPGTDYWWDCWEMRFKNQADAQLFAATVAAYIGEYK